MIRVGHVAAVSFSYFLRSNTDILQLGNLYRYLHRWPFFLHMNIDSEADSLLYDNCK